MDFKTKKELHDWLKERIKSAINKMYTTQVTTWIESENMYEIAFYAEAIREGFNRKNYSKHSQLVNQRDGFIEHQLDITCFFIEVEKDLDVEITDEVAEKMKTFEELTNYLYGK